MLNIVTYSEYIKYTTYISIIYNIHMHPMHAYISHTPVLTTSHVYRKALAVSAGGQHVIILAK